MPPYDLKRSCPAAAILLSLLEGEPCTTRGIHTQTGVPLRAIEGARDELAAGGAIRVEALPSDRRDPVRPLWLLPPGRVAARHIRDARDALLGRDANAGPPP